MIATLSSRPVRRALSAHPFLLLGAVTYALFLIVDDLGPEAHVSAVGHALTAVTRVLIVPMYLGWLLVSFAVVQVLGHRPTSPPAFVARLVALVVGFVPYLLADWLLRLRARGHGELAA